MEEVTDRTQIIHIVNTVNRHDTVLAVLDERMNNLGLSLGEIKDNHLSHLGAEVDVIGKQLVSLDKKVAYYTGAAAVLMTVANFLFNYFLK